MGNVDPFFSVEHSHQEPNLDISVFATLKENDRPFYILALHRVDVETLPMATKFRQES